MKNKIAKTVLGVSAFFCISAAYAADGTLHATGDVTNSTCAVDVAGTTVQYGTIDFGSVKKSMVYANGSVNTAKGIGPVFILFKDCTPSEQYTLTLSGANAAGDPEAIDNTAGAGQSNVNLQLRYVTEAGDYAVLRNGVKSPVFSVGAQSRSVAFDPYLYQLYLSTLKPGPAKFDVDYTVDFL
ncbi:fimbrial protein [Enterobacter kobei]|uniref:fimbrial protein n=1 Tax=Enterobacter kobei TaxID=208224 RepID=UPI003CF0A25C